MIHGLLVNSLFVLLLSPLIFMAKAKLPLPPLPTMKLLRPPRKIKLPSIPSPGIGDDDLKLLDLPSLPVLNKKREKEKKRKKTMKKRALLDIPDIPDDDLLSILHPPKKVVKAVPKVKSLSPAHSKSPHPKIKQLSAPVHIPKLRMRMKKQRPLTAPKIPSMPPVETERAIPFLSKLRKMPRSRLKKAAPLVVPTRKKPEMPPLVIKSPDKPAEKKSLPPLPTLSRSKKALGSALKKSTSLRIPVLPPIEEKKDQELPVQAEKPLLHIPSLPHLKRPTHRIKKSKALSAPLAPSTSDIAVKAVPQLTDRPIPTLPPLKMHSDKTTHAKKVSIPPLPSPKSEDILHDILKEMEHMPVPDVPPPNEIKKKPGLFARLLVQKKSVKVTAPPQSEHPLLDLPDIVKAKEDPHTPSIHPSPITKTSGVLPPPPLSTFSGDELKQFEKAELKLERKLEKQLRQDEEKQKKGRLKLLRGKTRAREIRLLKQTKEEKRNQERELQLQHEDLRSHLSAVDADHLKREKSVQAAIDKSQEQAWLHMHRKRELEKMDRLQAQEHTDTQKEMKLQVQHMQRKEEKIMRKEQKGKRQDNVDKIIADAAVTYHKENMKRVRAENKKREETLFIRRDEWVDTENMAREEQLEAEGKALPELPPTPAPLPASADKECEQEQRAALFWDVVTLNELVTSSLLWAPL